MITHWKTLLTEMKYPDCDVACSFTGRTVLDVAEHFIQRYDATSRSGSIDQDQVQGLGLDLDLVQGLGLDPDLVQDLGIDLNQAPAGPLGPNKWT